MPSAPRRYLHFAFLAAAMAALAACAEREAPAVALAAADRSMLAVVRVDGAPAEWDLEGRIARSLRARDIPARAGGAEGAGYVLRGETSGMKDRGNAMLNWELFDADGKSLGEVRQLASLKGRGGVGPDRATLDAIALAAAEGISRLVPIPPAETAAALRVAPAAGPASQAPAPASKMGGPATPAPVPAQTTAAPEPPAAKTTAAAGQTPANGTGLKKITVFWAQVAALRDKSAAEAWYVRLKRERADLLGDLPYIVTRADLGAGKGVWFRVRVGPFPGRTAAARMCRKLKSAGMDCLVGSSG